MAAHEPRRLSLRDSVVSRRGHAQSAAPARPSRVSPSKFSLRCSASSFGNTATERWSTRQSEMPFPSNTMDRSCGNGRRGSPSAPGSSSGTPSASWLCARCRCSRKGKALAASRPSSVCHVTSVQFSTSVRTRHTEGAQLRRVSGSPTGWSRGAASPPPGGRGLRRVFVRESHSSCGHSSQIASTSAQSSSRVLSSQKLFRFGKLQSPSQMLSG
mmetsp:Transcript_22380/g.62829  ORF Transcript_22380/g.62829 Transcript_22380/m.62829 type:complete len:214 (-) Transcript_22380:407-1048(-)